MNYSYKFFGIIFCVTFNTSAFSETIAGVDDAPINNIVVTATRESKPKNQVAEAVSVVTAKEIEQVSPSHPAEILNRMAGVHINNLGGEGHMTSIRQPITTSAVYLNLEDGIPARPTGVFNHNVLYEINVSQADRIEVIKGPGSSLYGSDSIGGIINSMTKPSPTVAEARINPEAGSYGWQRILFSGGAPLKSNMGYRVDANITESTGFRDESEYKRYSTTARVDGFISEATALKTIFSYTHVDQSGVSSLERYDFLNNVRKNFYHGDMGYRSVDALRLSSEFSIRTEENSLFTITPFYRYNKMELMPSWMLSYDPNVNTTEFYSLGALAKYRHRLNDISGEIIVGLDMDYSPTQYFEQRINLTPPQEGIYTSYALSNRVNYNYDADQTSLSPYVHFEWQASDKIRINTGLRYDIFRVSYTDKLDTTVVERQTGFGGFTHYRPDNQTLSYDHLSPKLGLIYAFTVTQDAYFNYRHSFRVPSIGQVFRSGPSVDTDTLKPVQADSIEMGFRGQIKNFTYDAAIYSMSVTDDIVGYIDPVANARRVANAGETLHEGIEISLFNQFSDEFSARAAISFTEQRYKNFTAIYGFPATEINFAGNDVGKAPSSLLNLSLQYKPAFLVSSSFELENERVGDYFTDETNTARYEGYSLLNLRGQYAIHSTLQIYARLQNIQDKRYSTQTSNQVGDPDTEYRPGLPRTFFLGLRAAF